MLPHVLKEKGCLWVQYQDYPALHKYQRLTGSMNADHFKTPPTAKGGISN